MSIEHFSESVPGLDGTTMTTGDARRGMCGVGAGPVIAWRRHSYTWKALVIVVDDQSPEPFVTMKLVEGVIPVTCAG